MVHRAVPELYDFRDKFSSTSVLASGVCITPDSAQFVQAGRVAMTQGEAGNMWTEYFGSDPMSNILQTEGFYSGPFPKGAYGFLKPRASTDLVQQKVFCSGSDGLATAVVAELVPASGWVVVAAVVPSSTGTGVEAASAYISTSTHMEYTTVSKWIDSELAPYTAQEFELAMTLFASIPQFHENPLHLRDILAFVKRAGRVMLKVAPGVLSAIGTAYPETLPVVGPMGALAGLAGGAMK
jgi:hypothetical protein